MIQGLEIPSSPYLCPSASHSRITANSVNYRESVTLKGARPLAQPRSWKAGADSNGNHSKFCCCTYVTEKELAAEARLKSKSSYLYLRT